MILALLTATQTLAASPARDPRVYSGRDRAINVPAPRIDADISIDGALTDSAWNSAALLTGFSQYQPVDGRAAEDSTHVLVWYAPAGIYFGVRAFESHGTVNPTLSDRDRIEADDYVQILIDTFNDRRQALVFGVNPLGIQSDGVQSEGQQHSRTALVTADLTRDFVYRSAGRVTASRLSGRGTHPLQEH